MEDMFVAVKDAFKERMVSPLVGSFVISWAVWNWKFLVIIFTGVTANGIFDLSEKIVFGTHSDKFMNGFVYPFVAALFYVFVYPIPAKFVYAYTLRRRREAIQARQEVENETPLTLEQSLAIRAKMNAQERDHKNTIDNLNQELELLKLQLKESFNSSSASADKDLDKFELLPDSQYRLMDFIGGYSSHDGISEKAFLNSISLDSRVEMEFDIGELIRLGLIEKKFEPRERTNNLMFTHEGRRRYLQEKKFRSA